MILLTATTDLIQLVTSAAATINVHASYMDYNGTTVTPGRQNTAITTATTTTIVSAPGASTQRNVKTIHVRNRHATLACIVTFLFDANGTDYELHSLTLAAGEAVEYIEGIGFFLLKSARLDRWLMVTGADYTNSTTGFTDVTGLTCPVLNGIQYNFEAMLMHISGATTTGFRFGINGPTLTGIRLVGVDVITASATADTTASGTATAVDTAVIAETTGAATDVMARFSGVFTAGANGTFAIRAAAEVAAIVTVRIGSWCHIWQPTG